MRRQNSRWIYAGIIILALIGIAAGWYRRGTQVPANSVSSSPEFVDARRCAECHAGTHAKYQHVGMARSFHGVQTGSSLAGYSKPARFVHKISGRHYEVDIRDGKAVQRRYEVGPDGRKMYLFELEVTHVIGSGNHARSYLHRFPSGEVIQLPLTWYSEEQSWGMSPGFDTVSPPDFTRVVDDTCLFCHNGYPRDNVLAEGIDCQRCHGPGARHAALARRGNSPTQEIRTSIVNPKRLSAERQMDICMQCHLETTSAELPQMIRRFNREPFSFRAGEPLGDYMVHFDHAAGAEANKFEIVGQAYRLRQSACFQKSAGRMTCSTCHDPHDVPRGEKAVAYYREKCKACHPSAPDKHPAFATADCKSCHMPKRRTEDAVHVSMTDHLVQRQKPQGDLLRSLDERHNTYRGDLRVYYPTNLPEADRDLYLGMALVSGSADRQQGVRLLERAAQADPHPKALSVLAEGYLANGNIDAAIATYKRALGRDPALANARYNLARALETAGRLPEARDAFAQLLQSRNDFPEGHYAFGNLLVRMGDRAGASREFDEAVHQRPVYAEARSNRAILYAEDGRIEEALRELTTALAINPAYVEAHNNSARVLASAQRIPDALQHARRAVTLKPDFIEARYNLARLLQQTNAPGLAIAEYRKLLSLKPEMAEAHLGLGQTLGDAGRIDEAIVEFREVLRLRPGHTEAQQNLAMALSLSGTRGR